MAATIVDIAERTGVSRTTVSNILNGRFKCSAETRERVLQAAREMDYQPNFAARTLVRRRSGLVGLVLPAYVDGRALSDSPFYNILIDAIAVGLGGADARDLIIKGPAEASAGGQIGAWARSRNLEGLILVGDWREEEIRAGAGLPLVFVDNYAEGGPGIYLNIDDSGGAALATTHLLERGYRRIAFCSTPPQDSAVNTRRYQGYCSALAASGREPLLLDPGGISWEAGRAAAPALASSGADALCVSSDVLALGILRGLTEAGVAVPGDMGILGFDNIAEAARSEPGLTTVDQDIYGKGLEAARLLLSAMEGGAPELEMVEGRARLVRPVTLVKRGSA